MSPKLFCYGLNSLVIIMYTYAATTIDQSQTGDLNVHVNLKDVRVIALMKNAKEEYVDYDYAYDYSEMTIKPLNSTTLKPLNTTDLMKDNSTDTTTEMILEITPPTKNTTLEEIVPLASVSVPTVVQTTTVVPTTKHSLLSVTVTTNAPLQAASTTVQSSTSTPDCKKGFIKNKKGECELKLQPNSTNALLKLVKLSQKLKLRREN